MDVEQAWDDQLAARINGLAGVRGNSILNGDDAARCNRDISNGIDRRGRIDDTTACDQQIVAIREMVASREIVAIRGTESAARRGDRRSQRPEEFSSLHPVRP